MNNKEIYYQITSLYDRDITRELHTIFNSEDISKMFKALIECQDYFKNIYGTWMKSRDITILAALRYMLLRPKEACCLKFADFDFRNSRVLIRGENNKQRKSRFVSVPDKFMQAYRSFTKLPHWLWKGSEYLFPSNESDHISSGQWKRIMREKILKPSGLWVKAPSPNKTFTRSYTLRASGATELLDNGADVWTVAQTLGHADLRTVKNYFFQTKRFRERQKDILDNLS